MCKDTEMESCETERSILQRRLAASAVEVERQVIELNMTCRTAAFQNFRMLDS